MAEPDPHTRLRSAIEERLALAQAAIFGSDRGVWVAERPEGVSNGTVWREGLRSVALRLYPQDAEHIAANSPDFVIRACRADLARLERHRPITAPTRLGYPGLVICAYEWKDGDGYIAIWSKDCPEVRSMAEVWLP